MSRLIGCLAVSASFLATGPLRADAGPAAEATPSAAPALAESPLPALEELERVYEGTTPPEGVRMLLAISKGSQMMPGEGWFGPAESRYSWAWLVQRYGVAADASIPTGEFVGEPAWAKRLDRNRDGQIAAGDLDWSDGNPWVQSAQVVNRVFRRMDQDGDGSVGREDWLAAFDALSGGGDRLRAGDFREALLAGVGGGGGFSPGDGPSKEVLLRGLFAGEIGSMHEGPKAGERAPDFALKTYDGSRTVRLSDAFGDKPVVLVFGNFTCGPFRSLYPGVEEVYDRFKDEATFLFIYVREAHPTDGWAMKSNERFGVAVTQPKTYEERVAVATRCHDMLAPSLPLLVDEINDPTGHAYSGMPARLYVIDPAGMVAYKSGRGPFGFKPGEMEQALVMALLEASGTPAPAGAK